MPATVTGCVPVGRDRRCAKCSPMLVVLSSLLFDRKGLARQTTFGARHSLQICRSCATRSHPHVAAQIGGYDQALSDVHSAAAAAASGV